MKASAPPRISDWAERRVAIPAVLDDLAPPDPRASVRTLTGRTMGTTWTVALVSAPSVDVEQVHATIVRSLDRVVAQMSTWLDGSDLSRFNRSAKTWYDLPSAFASVLGCALDVARESGGAYDPTVGPLVNLWGFGPSGMRRRLPAHGVVSAIRARCGWQQIEMEAGGRRARQPGGVYVDLSAIAKGFAVDEVCASLRTLDVDSYLVEIGGELRGRGMKPNAQPWWVAVEQPAGPEEWPGDDGERCFGGGESSDPPFDLVIALHDLSVATSGDYRKGFASRGRWYSHTIDPRSGRPVTHGLTSVTVLHRECMMADAWSTALMVLGPDDGMALAIEREIAALFIARTANGFEPRATPALEILLQ